MAMVELDEKLVVGGGAAMGGAVVEIRGAVQCFCPEFFWHVRVKAHCSCFVVKGAVAAFGAAVLGGIIWMRVMDVDVVEAAVVAESV